MGFTKATIKRDENDIISGFSCIIRDITAAKLIELEEHKRIEEISRLNNVSNKLSTLNFLTFQDLDALIQHICKETAIGLKIDRVALWNYEQDQIDLKTFMYIAKTNIMQICQFLRKILATTFQILNRNQ